MTESTELKPCPFCGSEAAFETHRWIDYPSTYAAGCTSSDCDVRPVTDQFDTMEAAAAAWNHRATVVDVTRFCEVSGL